MRMGDRVRFASDAEVINSLRELGLQLRSAGSTVPVRDKGDYLGFVLGHLVAYASGQLIRLASLYQVGIEMQASTTRNLFEVYLLCEYVLADPIRAKECVAQKASDELQIKEGFVGLSDDPNDPSLRPILERNDHIRRTMAKHGLPEGSTLVRFRSRQKD